MVKDGILNYSDDDEEESFSDDGDWGDWKADDNGLGVGEEEEDDGSESDFVCLFCYSHYVSCDLLFEHCLTSHGFDFHGIRNELKLDFYASFKLINYIRSQVGEISVFFCFPFSKFYVVDKCGSFDKPGG